MNLHRLAEERSLAYHTVVANRLDDEPRLLDVAKGRVAGWIEAGSPHPHYAHAWCEILGLPVAAIRRHLTDESERGRALRQVTPFAGLIDPRERWSLWRATRERLAPSR